MSIINQKVLMYFILDGQKTITTMYKPNIGETVVIKQNKYRVYDIISIITHTISAGEVVKNDYSFTGQDLPTNELVTVEICITKV